MENAYPGTILNEILEVPLPLGVTVNRGISVTPSSWGSKFPYPDSTASLWVPAAVWEEVYK